MFDYNAEKISVIKLNSALCHNSDKAIRLIRHFGGAQEVLMCNPEDIFNDGSFTLDSAEKLSLSLKTFDIDAELNYCEKNNIKILTLGEEAYPKRLAQIYDPPLVLYVKGNIDNFDMPASGIVGTRRPSPYGLRTTVKIASELAQRNVAVVSGLARGIDSAAHKAALNSKGITWAALGRGLADIYPPENRKLADEICANNGTLLTEFPLNEISRAANFPRRNRIISGLSYTVLVVEGTFKSGSLITARCALEQGKDVLAVPGNIESKMAEGPNHLIKNGAYLAEAADDIINCFPSEVIIQNKKQQVLKGNAESAINKLSPDALQCYRLLSESGDGMTADEICLKINKTVQQTSELLFELEISSLIIQISGHYVIK